MSKFQGDLFKLHIQDVRDMLNDFPKSPETGEPEKIVNVTITSPPYYDLKDYGFKEQIGYGQSYEKYLSELERVFGDVYKVTADSGSLWIVIDCFKRKGRVIPLPFDIERRIRKCGWRLKDTIIWKKDKTLPWSRKGELRSIFEYILFFTKTKHFKYKVDRIKIPDPSQLKEWWVKYPERYNPLGKVPTNVWSYPIPVQGSWGHRFLRHFCPFPVGMVERILLLTTDEGDTVLDPFAGSGVVLAVAESLKRRYIGFELKKEYVKLFPSVKSEIREEMKQRRKRYEEFEKTQEKLKDLILRLRLVKFPKSLARRVHTEKLVDERQFPLNTIFAISRGFEEEKLRNREIKFLKEDLIIVLDSVTIKDKSLLLGPIKLVSTKPPLSKFGIEARFFIYTKDEFAKKHQSKPLFEWTKLWLYTKGVMNKFEKSISFEEWKQLSSKPMWRKYFKNHVPPVVSDVKVHQEVIKTWKPKNKEPFFSSLFEEKRESLMEYI